MPFSIETCKREIRNATCGERGDLSPVPCMGLLVTAVFPRTNYGCGLGIVHTILAISRVIIYIF